MRRRSEWQLENGKPLVQIMNENTQLDNPEYSEDMQAQLETILNRYTSQGASGAWRVHGSRLACFPVVLGETEDRNDVSAQWYDECILNTWVDSLIMGWLRERILPMLVNGLAEYPEPVQDEASNEALLHEPEGTQSTLPCAPPYQWAVLFCALPGHVCHLKWWLTKFFAGHMNIFYMYAELGNDECTEMLLKLQDLPNPVLPTVPGRHFESGSGFKPNRCQIGGPVRQ